MWFFRPSRRWDWLQLEVSSQCPAACIYCPTALFREEGNNRLMTMETFNRILPAFSRSRMVFLQGWGEPFMNPNLFEMFRQAKASGCLVGTTTNGMLLDAGRLERLVNGGVDIVAFSLAGCGKTNDAVRKGTSLARLLEVIHRLNRIKGNTGSSRPEIHIAYMLLRSGLDEIERLPILLAGQGIAQVVVSTLDFVPVPEIAREALAAGAEIINDISAMTFDEAMSEAVRDSGAAIVLMHMRGKPKDMQLGDLTYRSVQGDVFAYLEERIDQAVSEGLRKEQMIIDPGLGFGKTPADSLKLLKHLREFRALGRPILVGPSKKRFVALGSGGPEFLSDPQQRLEGTAAAVAAAIMNGAHIVRVHDVPAMKKVAAMTDALLSA